jgi:putative hemolysin
VAGLILDELGAIPKVGERLTWQGVSLEVIDMDGPRIDRVLVHAAAEAPGDESGKALEPGDG